MLKNTKSYFYLFLFLAALVFTSQPLFAKAKITSTSTVDFQGVSEMNVDNSDFEKDVQNAKNDLAKDIEAQKLQNKVVDGEDGHASESDSQDNQHSVNEYKDIQQAESEISINENNQDINNSGIDEVNDTINNLDEQSKDVMNEQSKNKDNETSVGDNSSNN